MKIQYLNRIDAIKNDKIIIENAIVRSFWKSTIIDIASFDDVECDILKEVLIEDYNEELNNRIADGKTNLTKIKLEECLPEEADYVSVNHSIRNSFVCISDITDVRLDDIYEESEIIDCYNNRKIVLSNQTRSFPIIKWI